MMPPAEIPKDSFVFGNTGMLLGANVRIGPRPRTPEEDRLFQHLADGAKRKLDEAIEECLPVPRGTDQGSGIRGQGSMRRLLAGLNDLLVTIRQPRKERAFICLCTSEVFDGLGFWDYGRPKGTAPKRWMHIYGGVVYERPDDLAGMKTADGRPANAVLIDMGVLRMTGIRRSEDSTKEDGDDGRPEDGHESEAAGGDDPRE